MKRLAYLLLVFAFFGCEDDIFPELEQTEARIVVDAWITNEPATQLVKVTETLPYYTNTFAPGISNAVVYIVEDDTERYDFTESGQPGYYEWNPSAGQPVLGKIGSNYQLVIEHNGETITSFSQLNRVPAIDSITFSFETGSFIPDSYFAEFFARDFQGPGDTYWVKTYKNGEYLNLPNEINIAYDASTSAGANVDGLYFIQPIRNAINPFETDENDEFLSPYNPGDSIRVELYSITNEAFYFLAELRIQTDRPGGFGELFATPLSNVGTNITSSGSDPVIGFFNMSAVSSMEGYLDPNNLPVD